MRRRFAIVLCGCCVAFLLALSVSLLPVSETVLATDVAQEEPPPRPPINPLPPRPPIDPPPDPPPPPPPPPDPPPPDPPPPDPPPPDPPPPDPPPPPPDRPPDSTPTPTATATPTATPTVPPPPPSSGGGHRRSTPTVIPEGRIIGTVFDQNDVPVPNVEVSVGGVIVRSNANGNYERARLFPGIYVLRLRLLPAEGTPQQGNILLLLGRNETIVQDLYMTR